MKIKINENNVFICDKYIMKSINNSRIIKVKNEFIIVELYDQFKFNDAAKNIYNILDIQEVYYINKVIKSDNDIIHYHFTLRV